MKKKNPATLKFTLFLIGGVMLGAICFSALRTFYYLMLNYQPEMHPVMFIYFAPIIGVFISIIALIVETPLYHFTQLVEDTKHGFIIGISYTALLLCLTFEIWMIIVFLIFNPITIHVFLYINRKRKEKSLPAPK